MSLTLTDSASEIRTALGTGTAAVLDVGTSENNVLQINGSGALPAIDGSNITGLGSSLPYFDVYKGSSMTPTSNTPTDVVCDWENSDTEGWHDTSTGFFQPDVNGTYLITAQATMDSNGDNQLIHARIWFDQNYNTMVMAEDEFGSASSSYASHKTLSIILSLTTSDFVNLRVYVYDSSGNPTVYGGDEKWLKFHVQRLA